VLRNMLFTPGCAGRLTADGADDMARDVAVLRGAGSRVLFLGCM
jgi:hypothetical protein